MNRLRKQLLPVITFARIDVRRLFRDKVAIFFVFVFPLIFLVIFGGLFGDNDDISFNVALINRSDTEFATRFEEELRQNEIIDVNDEVTTEEQAREKMNRSEIEATIILPEGFGAVGVNAEYPAGQAQVLYDQNKEQAGRTLTSLLDAVFKDINNELVPSVEPFTVEAQSTATSGLSRFDYTFSGLLGFTILSLGVFGPTNVFPRLKQKGVLRRYHTTSLKVWQYFTGNVLSNAAVGILSVGFMFVAALLFFELNMRGDYVSLLIWTVLGVTLLFGVGLSVGGWAKNENQAAPLANLITFPMMFLSGIFFPTFLMPQWLQNITQFIPLTPVVDGLRLIITEGKTILDLGVELSFILVWMVVIYTIAFRVFRWE